MMLSWIDQENKKKSMFEYELSLLIPETNLVKNACHYSVKKFSVSCQLDPTKES